MREINLLPKTLKEKQKAARVHFLINGLSVILLILVSTVLAVLFSYRLSLTRNLNTHNKKIAVFESSITQLREEEGLYRFLELKLTAFAKNLEEREVHGEKIAKLREVFSNTANLTGISIEKGGKISVSGEVISFPELAKKFIDLENYKLFETFEITLLSVNQEKGTVEFAIQGKPKNTD